MVALGIGAWPAFSHFGFGFLASTGWNPVTDEYGALPAIFGTLVTSAIAMLIGVPLALGRRGVPDRAMPAFVAPADRHHDRAAGGDAQHHLRHLGPVRAGAVPAAHGAAVPDRHVRQHSRCSALLFEGPPLGLGMLTAGFILAMMVLPFIASVMRDVFLTVPAVLRESAYGVGATTVGSGARHRRALYPHRHHRRRHAGARAGAGRDHGRHLRHRQRARNPRLAAGAGHHHLGDARQRIHRGGDATSTSRRCSRWASSCSSSPSSCWRRRSSCCCGSSSGPGRERDAMSRYARRRVANIV